MLHVLAHVLAVAVSKTQAFLPTSRHGSLLPYQSSGLRQRFAESFCKWAVLVDFAPPDASICR